MSQKLWHRAANAWSRFNTMSVYTDVGFTIHCFMFRLVHVIIRMIWAAWNQYGELEECVRSGHEFISTCLIIFSSYRYLWGLLRNQKGGGRHFRLINLILVRKKGLIGRHAGLKWFCTLMSYHNQKFSTLDTNGSRAVAMVDTYSGVGMHFSHMDVWNTTYHVDICTCKIHVTLQTVFFCSLFGQFVSSKCERRSPQSEEWALI